MATAGVGPNCEVRLQRYPGFLACDVIVVFRGRKMVVQLPDYVKALKWTQMECRAHKIPADILEDPE
jgi:hypothetical protein